jgi:intein-encoded DNA endonuclease-like protein
MDLTLGKSSANSSTRHYVNLFDEWNETSTYLLGYIEADGSIAADLSTFRVTFATSEHDRNFLEKIYQLTGFTGKITEKEHDLGKYGKHRTASFTISSKPWSRRIRKLLRTGETPPIPDNLLHHYVRGYFDGDGSIFWDKRAGAYRSNLVFNSSELAEAFARKLRPLTKSKLIVHKKTSSNQCWYLACGNQATENLVRYMYEGASIYLQRKRNLASFLL